MGGCVYMIYKYDTILHKGLEHPQIFIPMGVLDLIPQGY